MEDQTLNQEPASAEETTEAFLTGWDEVEAAPAGTAAEEAALEEAPAADSGPEAAGAAAPEADEASPASGAEAEPPPQTPADGEAPPPSKTWTVRHMDEEKTISADDADVPVLLQKGMDYDRIRARYDAAKPVMEIFAGSAKQNHMTVDEYVAFIRREAKKAAGMGDEEAQRAVALEDREAALSAKEAEAREAQAATGQAAAARRMAEERRKADIAEFQKIFPDAAKDPQSIPQAVWDRVNGGERLVTAYALYQAQQARSEAEALKAAVAAKDQNAKNEARSTGSVRTAGDEGKGSDPFLAGWGD